MRAAVCANVVYYTNVGMIQGGDGLRLADEALLVLRILRDVLRKDLDGDHPVEARAASLVDFTHSPRSNLLEQLVWSEICSRSKHHDTFPANARILGVGLSSKGEAMLEVKVE